MVRNPSRLLCLVCILAAVPGCLGIDLKGGRSDGPAVEGATTWPFVPASMRVSPFTSVGYDEQKQSDVLNLMVELRDRVGDLTKGVGEFAVELRQAGEGVGAEGDVLYTWTASVLTIEQNVQHFNSALSVYHLKLAMDAPPPPGKAMRVIVRFTDPGGKRLLAEGQITPDAAPEER